MALDLNQVLFEIFGIKITILGIGGAVLGAVPAIAALHRVYDWWETREQRHLELLYEYLEREEKSISARRRDVLTGIFLANDSFLDDKKLDIGRELDEAIRYLDAGRPHRAEARLHELLKKVQTNSRILERRVHDLKRHERSINIFLAAVADRAGNIDEGLSYVADALNADSSDLDALKYRGILLLKKKQLDLAEQAFNRMKTNSRSALNRADAWLGLALVSKERGIKEYDESARALGNALTNLNGLPPSRRDSITKISSYEALASLHSEKKWQNADSSIAKDACEKALKSLAVLPNDSRIRNDWQRKISADLWRLENALNNPQHDRSA